MKTTKITLIALLVLTSITAAEQTETRRYLLSAGANNGGRERVLLRYAVTDAKAFASVLLDMGGVDKSNALILTDPNSRELLNSITRLNRLIANNRSNAPDVKHEVFVYYSGHADTDGLKLGSETLTWATFRNAVNELDADVRVAIIDACGSGAITRTKGGTLQPAFMADASSNMKGYAFLTSSNENEKSQESDRIRGSFFTHALLSGMRGAADMTGDGKVTINEAYQYAFNETLQSTQNTAAGAQHPSRDMNLAGTGDIVMTDLRETNAVLFLTPDIEGRLFIRDATGNLFAELRKMRGRGVNLGITPGKYSVQVETSSKIWMAGEVQVASNGRTQLSMGDMRAIRKQATVARGNSDSPPHSYSLNASVLFLSFAYGAGENAKFFPAARGLGESQFGLINVAGELEYAQGGLINVTNTGGFQAGLINAGNDVGRFQVGLFNVAGNTGRQIGLVNYARHSEKTPIGILSIVGNGIYDATAYADVTGEFYTSIRTGTPWLYNLFEYSSIAHDNYRRNAEHSNNFWSIGWGLGTRFGMRGRFAANFDFVWQSVGSKQERITSPDDEVVGGGTGDNDPPITSDPTNTTNGNRWGEGFIPPNLELPIINVSTTSNDYYKFRFGGSYRPLPYLAFTGGVSLNAIFDSFSESIAHEPAGKFYWDHKSPDLHLRLWPSLYAGITLGRVGW
jgi:hypothetical protein